MIVLDILRLLLSIGIAFFAGKLIAKLKLPSILGWLIVGMVIGPHAIGLLDSFVLDSAWFDVIESVFECTFGLIIGTELIWKQMKKAGKQILLATLTESLGTFFVVTLVFGLLFWFSGIPIYLAFLFGGIALATAPAPSLSIVRDMKADGPVTKTLIPMAALDDLVAALVFFSVIAVVSAHLSVSGLSLPLMIFLVFLPVLLGIVIGILTGLLLRLTKTIAAMIALVSLMILASAALGFFINSLLPSPILNFMLLGISFSAVFANMIPLEKLERLMQVMNPAIGLAMIVAILNLGAGLDYHLIFGAGIYTAVYILARAAGKYSGAYFGAEITHAPKTVKRYLGFTLLPHSGVSLVFTSIAVSTLSASAPDCAAIIQGTIAAAAVINEIIAVFMVKKGFEWAGELNKAASNPHKPQGAAEIE